MEGQPVSADQTAQPEELSDFEKCVSANMDLLRDAETKVVLELAMTTPGGPCDAPFAPIDPTLHAAAVRLVEEAGLQDQLRYFRNR